MAEVMNGPNNYLTTFDDIDLVSKSIQVLITGKYIGRDSDYSQLLSTCERLRFRRPKAEVEMKPKAESSS